MLNNIEIPLQFPFFCSDREYLIGRRIFEYAGTFFCITKVCLLVVLMHSSCIRPDKNISILNRIITLEQMYTHNITSKGTFLAVMRFTKCSILTYMFGHRLCPMKVFRGKRNL